MPEFTSRWLDFTPAPTHDATDKAAKSPSVSFVSAIAGTRATLTAPEAAAADARIPPGYVASVRALMARWFALGRPILLMPRRLGIGAPYVVDDLGDWFTVHSLADPPANGWGPRRPDELALLDGVLTELEGRIPEPTLPSGRCIRCGNKTVAPSYWHCRGCLDAATNDERTEE